MEIIAYTKKNQNFSILDLAIPRKIIKISNYKGFISGIIAFRQQNWFIHLVSQKKKIRI